jgi:hypothetical protein
MIVFVVQSHGLLYRFIKGCQFDLERWLLTAMKRIGLPRTFSKCVDTRMALIKSDSFERFTDLCSTRGMRTEMV